MNSTLNMNMEVRVDIGPEFYWEVLSFLGDLSFLICSLHNLQNMQVFYSAFGCIKEKLRSPDKCEFEIVQTFHSCSLQSLV